MAASVMFHLAGVDKQALPAGVRDDPQTYRDWGGGGELEGGDRSGKEDDLFSPYLGKPFAQAIADGVHARCI